MMWCSECQAEVRASKDYPGSCARCGTRLRMAGDATIREARDIISRWSSSDLMDQISSLPTIPQFDSAAHSSSSSIESATETSVAQKEAESDSASKDAEDHPAFTDSDGQDRQPSKQSGGKSGDSTQSILAAIHKLARRSSTKSKPHIADDVHDESPAELTNSERNEPIDPVVDVTELFETSLTQAEASSEVSNAKPDPMPEKPRESSPLKPPQPEGQNPELPTLSSLLKKSQSESVGQLAWWNESERFRSEEKSAVGSSDELSGRDIRPFEPVELHEGSQGSSLSSSDSDQSDLSSQLRREDAQLQAVLDSQTESEQHHAPENLTASDQVALKSGSKEIPHTRSEEHGGVQPILPVELDGRNQSRSAEADASKRSAQSRNVQRRTQQGRNLRSQPVANKDAVDKGMNTVSRKYRIDNPNAEPVAPSNIADAKAPSGSSNSNASGRRFRIDSAEGTGETLDTADNRVRTQGRSKRRYIDDAHADAMRGPHFQVVSKKRSNLASMTGQFLAYIGVLGLTIGTAIVIYGHFGGVSEYTPTGWLVTTVAQMMLFLGVINLVSGGIEQNNEDVSTRINTLGEQLMRIEQVTEEAMRGPKISASRYADPNGSHEESRQRETSDVSQ